VPSSTLGTSKNASDFGRLQAWLDNCDGGTAFLRLLDELVLYYDSFTDDVPVSYSPLLVH